MDQHRMLVTLSAVPLALVGVGALTIAASSAMSGFGNPIPWSIVGPVVIASAIGVTRGAYWAFVGEFIIGAILVLAVAIVTLFSLAMASATSGGLDGGMFGTPFGVLSGWASLVLYTVTFAASVWMLAASRLGLRSTRS
jgi:hypothetical protein